MNRVQQIDETRATIKRQIDQKKNLEDKKRQISRDTSEWAEKLRRYCYAIDRDLYDDLKAQMIAKIDEKIGELETLIRENNVLLGELYKMANR